MRMMNSSRVVETEKRNCVTRFDFQSPRISLLVKQHLMSRDPELQMVAVESINIELNIASEDVRELLIEILIDEDIIIVLCDAVACSNGKLLTAMLDVLQKVRFHINFYKRSLAVRAIESILRIAFFMTKKPDDHMETLSLITHTLFVIIEGSAVAKISLERICSPEQMILFIKNLEPLRSPKYVLRLSATSILRAVMNHVRLGHSEELDSSIFPVFKDSILSIKEIVEKHKDQKDHIVLNRAMRLICATCATAIRFCETEDPELMIGFVTEEKINFRRQTHLNFTKEITNTIAETVIPYFNEIEFDRDSFNDVLHFFVKCLNDLFQINTCDTEELSNLFAIKGYLKYFLQSLLNPSVSNIRGSIGFLLSSVITKLAESCDCIEKTSSVAEEFRKFIYEGISLLPNEMVNLPLVIESDGIASDALVILLYYHFHGTCDEELFSLSSMIGKLVNLPQNKPNHVVKASWFLFAITSLRNSAEISVANYENAVDRLSFLLQTRDLRNCYTHHPAILYHGMHCLGFSKKLRFEIIRLWLDFDGLIKTLMDAQRLELTTDCLLNTVEISSENLVNRALEGIKELMNDKICKERISAITWQILPQVLTSYTKETAANVKGMLEITQGTKPDENLEMDETGMATSLVKIFIKEDDDQKLKILVVNNLHKLLVISSARNSSKAAIVCVNDPKLVKNLHKHGFSRLSDRLSAGCFHLLALIICYQRKFNIESEENRVIKIESLDMLVQLARDTYETYCGGIKLLIELLNCDSKTIIPVASLSDFKDEAETIKAVFAWYRMLQHLHANYKILPNEIDLVFQGLTAILHYCHQKKYKKLSNGLCDHMGNYFLVNTTIDNKYKSAAFIDFLITWICYGLKYRSMNVLSALVVKKKEIKKQTLCLMPFEKILERLDKYLDEVRSSGLVSEILLTELNSCLDTFRDTES